MQKQEMNYWYTYPLEWISIVLCWVKKVSLKSLHTFDSIYMIMIVLYVNLTGPQGAQIFDQTL